MSNRDKFPMVQIGQAGAFEQKPTVLNWQTGKSFALSGFHL